MKTKLTLAALVILISSTCFAGFLSRNPKDYPAAPLTETAFDKIDKALDEGTLINAAAICKSDMSKCVLELAREIQRAFVKAGYNVDKSLAGVCKSQGHVMAMQSTYWRDIYAYLIGAVQDPKAASTLIQEGVFTQKIVDQCRVVTK